MAGDQPVAGVVINEARKQAFTLRVGPGPICVMVGRKLGLDGTNVNQLTSQHLTDLGRGPVFYDCLVEVQLSAPQPALRTA